MRPAKQFFTVCVALLLGLSQGYAQLTLQTCYDRANQNYPMVKQRDLIQKSREYSLHNATLGYLPTVSINGQQSYQSDVTKVPSAPGQDFSVPTLSKNQYKAYADVGLNLYDGGVIHQQKQLHEANAQVDEQTLEVTLYQLRERVNQVYFGILMIDAQLAQKGLLISDLEAGLRKTTASITNGTALKSSADLLKAEILNTKQSTIELQSSREGYINMLSLLIGMELTEATTFEAPSALSTGVDIHRPELKLYDLQARRIDVEQKILNTRITPRLSSFLQAGYGKPGLNMLNPNADTYYIAGFRLNWNLTGFYTIKKEKQLLEIRRSTINLQRETFAFNSNYEIRQRQSEVMKLQKIAAADDEIIALRTQVKQTSSVQLENGVIDANDYLHEVNAENQARQNKAIHEIQLLLAQYALQTTTGI